MNKKLNTLKLKLFNFITETEGINTILENINCIKHDKEIRCLQVYYSGDHQHNLFIHIFYNDQSEIIKIVFSHTHQTLHINDVDIDLYLTKLSTHFKFNKKQITVIDNLTVVDGYNTYIEKIKKR